MLFLTLVYSCSMRHAPVDAPLQILNILLIFAHALARGVRNLRDVLTIAESGLHDDVQSRHVGIIGQICADTKSNLCTAIEVCLEVVCLLEVKAVAEQQSFGSRIDSQTFVVVNHLLAPLIRVTAVVTYATEQGCIFQLEVLKEAISGDSISQGDTVQYSIFFSPCLQRIPVGVCRIVLMVSLANAHNPFMSHRTHGSHTVLLGEVHIGCADTHGIVVQGIVLTENLDRQVLCLSRKTATKAKFAEHTDVVSAVNESCYLSDQLFREGSEQLVIVVVHAEVDLVYNTKHRNFVHRSVQPSSLGFDSESALCILGDFEVLITRLPKAKEIHIGTTNPLDSVKICQFVLSETQFAVFLQLMLDFFHHLFGELHVLVAALEGPGGLVAWKLMINGLAHAEFVHIGFQKTGDDRFHVEILLVVIKLSFSLLWINYSILSINKLLHTVLF